MTAAASPLAGHVAAALAPLAGARQARTVATALHALALDGRAPALAEALATGDRDAAAGAAINAWRSMTDEVEALAAGRPSPARLRDTAPHAVLRPAVAEASHRADAQAVGLVDVGSATAWNLNAGLVGITYDDGRTLGDPSSAVEVACAVAGDGEVPVRPLPDVVARIGIDREALDVNDPVDARWLRSSVWPDEPARRARLEAELALTTAPPPVERRRGDPLDALPDALAHLPAGVLPVVLTTWALSRLRPERRRRFIDVLRDAADGDRTVAWVSVEGVGVAPMVPTLGDRPASGHSIIGLGLFDGREPHVVALGRCWSNGRWMSWLV